MAYQKLTGVKITPRGNHNLARFKATMQDGAWPNSFAFGGWIYNASVDIGYSNRPTEIKLSIVLDSLDKSQQAAFFDIKSEDLRCDAGLGQDENLFDIDMNGIRFTDFVLFSYETSIENNNKTLSVVFKDYSIILDKIYIGLIKRQGNRFVDSTEVEAGFPVRCVDCLLSGDSVTIMASVRRTLAFGSYVGINGAVYDNFRGNFDDIYVAWNSLFNAAPTTPFFDLNGGYLILGTENIAEEVCDSLPEVTYNFNELLASLRFRGMKFEGAFPVQRRDGQFIYKQNYIGSLREVLQNWCSDLGYDFYCEGKTLIGIDITKAFDIDQITSVADPTSELGANFAVNKPVVIKSYREGVSLDNTFKQAVITENSKGKESKTHSKSLKRYVGFTPLHPLDINKPSYADVTRYDVFEYPFADYALTNSFLPGSAALDQIMSSNFPWELRPFRDIDACMALAKYSPALRDLYLQDVALHGDAASAQAAYMALGFVPLVEITDQFEKSLVIDHLYSSEANALVSSTCLDSKYFKCWIGYYYKEHKEETVRWETESAELMYKLGALKKGLTQQEPYMPPEIFQNNLDTEGLYTSGGLSLTRITHQFEPHAEIYYDLSKAPYKDILLYSGLMNDSRYISPNLYIANLDNDWGTLAEDFNSAMSWALDDPCVSEFNQNASVVAVKNVALYTNQDWRLDFFLPRATPDIEEFYNDFESQLQSQKVTGIDHTVERYYDLKNRRQKDCNKLHLFTLVDTRTHPNVDLRFTPRGRETVNPVVLQKYIDRTIEEEKRLARTKIPNVCEKSLLTQICDYVLNASGADPRFGCVVDDTFNPLRDGFPYTLLTSPNSRSIDIRVEKNPPRFPTNKSVQALVSTADANGELYFADWAEGFNVMQNAVLQTNIIYPVSLDPISNTYYRGVLTSAVEIENRAPEMVEILGEPVNSVNNNVANIKVVNNPVDKDLQPQLDPFTNRFMSYITIRDSGQVLTTVEQYHNAISSLNTYGTNGPTQTVDITFGGTPDFFGTFQDVMRPVYGMTKLSISVNDNGVETSVSFSDKPPQPPKQEAILNKIGPRIL